MGVSMPMADTCLCGLQQLQRCERLGKVCVQGTVSVPCRRLYISMLLYCCQALLHGYSNTLLCLWAPASVHSQLVDFIVTVERLAGSAL